MGHIIAPIIILGAPRSGTTILQRCLYLHPDLWHLYSESHAILEGPFHPFRAGFDSNRVTADDLSDEVAGRLRQVFYRRAINANLMFADPVAVAGARSLGERLRARAVAAWGSLSARRSKPDQIRFLEKTPKNSLRVPMLNKLFPDALFVYIRRDPARNIDSLIAGWHAEDRIGPLRRERFATYPLPRGFMLAGYTGRSWRFALVPGWGDLNGSRVEDVAAWQYAQCNRCILDDLEAIPGERVISLKYEDFIAGAPEVIGQVLAWAGLPPSATVGRFTRDLPRVGDVRGGGEDDRLRYPRQVASAIGRTPGLAEVVRRMGFENL